MGFRSGLLSILRTMMTGSTIDNARLRVDVGQTGFFEGRELRVMFDIKGASAVLKIALPVNTTLQNQSLFGNDGTVKFTAYSADQGSAGGTWGDGVNLVVIPNNNMTTAPDYVFQSTVETGGTFTPAVGQKPRDRATVTAATATAQRSSVGAGGTRERGVAPNTYYLVFNNPDGSVGDAEYNLILEERP